MNKESFELMKKELLYIVILFLIALIIFKIIYYKDSFIATLRFVASLFWLFAIPGYIVMFYWKEKLDFTERFIIGIALSAAVIGVSSYYIGLIGLNIKYHGILLPVLMIIAGIAVNLKK
mgnify:CR=1 FL=1